MSETSSYYHSHNKQLLCRGLSYLPEPKSEADNTRGSITHDIIQTRNSTNVLSYVFYTIIDIVNIIFLYVLLTTDLNSAISSAFAFQEQ